MATRFQVWCYSKNPSNDAAVRRAAGKDDFGSGMGFGFRDISFFAQNENHAIRMKDRLLKVDGVSHVEIIDSESKNPIKKFKKG